MAVNTIVKAIDVLCVIPHTETRKARFEGSFDAHSCQVEAYKTEPTVKKLISMQSRKILPCLRNRGTFLSTEVVSS